MSKQEKQIIFNHVVLEGSAYEVGRLQGERMKAIPGAAAFFASGRGAFSGEEMGRVFDLFDAHCPGINEEIRGVADGLNVPPAHIAYYAGTYLRSGHCSHWVALPSMTRNNHVLVGRSYEFSDAMDDLCLCTTRIHGKPAHVGFSTLLFGRGEGMNEHGLSVTTSSGGMPVGAVEGMRPPIQDGLHFWALVRALLDQCKNTEEALKLIEEIPVCSNPNLIVADKQGNAALVEIFGPHKAVKRIDDAGSDRLLCSTNHFTLPKTREQDAGTMKNSRVRHRAIMAELEEKAPGLTLDDMKTWLSTPYPDGLCCHFYEEFFGTLRAMVFDLTAGTLDVCFGSPMANAWRRFDLSTTAHPGPYPAILPRELTSPSFWQ